MFVRKTLRLRSTHFILHFFFLGLFIIVVSPNLFSDGMFMDGIFYAAIARNLSEGIGSFWHMQLAQDFGVSFYEHPPLAMGLQGLLFKLFGDHILVERLYSLLTYVITGVLIVKIWRLISTREIQKFSWMAIFYWISVPLVIWGVTNNLLENTMMVFTTLSLFYGIRAYQLGKRLFFFFAGISLTMAFLSKGFVGLFPFSLPFFLWIFMGDYRFRNMLTGLSLMTVGFVLPLLGLFIFYPAGIDSLMTYIDNQVMGSIQDRSTVDSRLFIVWRLIKEIAPMLLIAGLILLIKKLAKTNKPLDKDIKSWLLALCCVGLSGVLPIMVSMKQSGFYIICTFPVFAIAIALLSVPSLVGSVKNWNGEKVISWLTICVLITGIIVSIYHSNRIGRDEFLIGDVHQLAEIMPEDEIIKIPDNLWTNWSLHGYLQRNAKISLTRRDDFDTTFYLNTKLEGNPDAALYEKVEIELAMLDLYKVKKSN